MDSSHFGVTPTELCDAVLSGLSALQVVGNVGAVRTIGRVKGEKVPDLKGAMLAGVPAILLHYSGGSTERARATHGQLETDTLNFKLLCIAGQLETIGLRMDGEGERDWSEVTPDKVGVEQLQDWGRYFALRALKTAGGKQVRTVRFTQGYRISPEHFIGAVELTCQREVDMYDDATAVYLQTLGICHDPTNGEGGPWFEPADNETPISDWPPPGVDGGVATL